MTLYLRMYCLRSFSFAKPVTLFHNLKNNKLILIQKTEFHNSCVLRSITPLNVKPQFNVNTSTNTIKDVILFKYDNPTQFKMMNIFAITQFVFWVYLSHFAYTTLKSVPASTDKDAPWYLKINFGDPKYKNGMTYGSFFFGWFVLGCAWFYTLRSVRYLILRKGGKTVSIVTYTPFGKNRIMDVSLEKVSAKESRANAKSYLPLKVKNVSLHYMMDMSGEFLNPKLFDFTAGLKRKLN